MQSLTFAALIALFSACGQNDTPSSSLSPYDNPNIYFSTASSVSLEVAYEPGAEPYTGTGLGEGQLWDFSRQNIAALFVGRNSPVKVTVPMDLTQMTPIPVQGKTSWTAEEILNFAVVNRKNHGSAGAGQFYVIFLNGYYNDGEPNQNVIGARISGSSIIAIFKPVVTTSAIAESMDVAKYVEQSTLTHEMGHALGLVDLGITLTSAHQDDAHPGHCTNPNCVMYYLNHEGGSGLGDLVKGFLASGNPVIFGSECLQDARSFKPS